MYPLGLFAASFSDHLRQLCSSSTVNDPKPNVERRHLAFLLGTIHETLNSLSCTLSSRATSQQELVSPGALTSHAFTLSVAVGCAAPLHVPCPWAWLLSSSLSLSAHTHSFSARGCARGFPPQRAGQTCKHSPNPRAQGSLPGPAGVSRYRPASSCTYLTSFFSNSGQASNRSATRP